MKYLKAFENQNDLRKYGIFAYLRDNGDCLEDLSEYEDDIDDAKEYAYKLFSDVKEYADVEVWERDSTGTFGIEHTEAILVLDESEVDAQKFGL